MTAQHGYEDDENISAYDEALDAAVDDDGADDAQEEARARASGWRPQAEFRGDPARWVDARAWNEKAERITPVMRDNNKRMVDTIFRQNRELQDLRTKLDEVTGLLQAGESRRVAQERAQDIRARQQLRTAAREAAAVGDMEQYDRIMAEIDQLGAGEGPPDATGQGRSYGATPGLQRQGAEPPPERQQSRPDQTSQQRQPAAPAAPVQLPPEVEAFRADNPWFDKDETLRRAMIGQHNSVITEFPDMPLDEQLDLALERLVALHPHRFQTPNEDTVPPSTPQPPRAPRVGRPQPPAPRTTARGIDGLPAAERTAARQGYLKAKRDDPDLTEAEYVRTYNDPSIDILAVRRARKAKQG